MKTTGHFCCYSHVDLKSSMWVFCQVEWAKIDACSFLQLALHGWKVMFRVYVKGFNAPKTLINDNLTKQRTSSLQGKWNLVWQGWARVSGNLQLSLTASKLVRTNCFSVATPWCILLALAIFNAFTVHFFFVKVLIIEYVFLLICLKIFRYFVPAICCICVWIYLYLWWQTGRRDWCIRPVWPAELYTLWIRSQFPHCTPLDQDRMRRGVMVIRLGHPHIVKYGWVG